MHAYGSESSTYARQGDGVLDAGRLEHTQLVLPACLRHERRAAATLMLRLNVANGDVAVIDDLGGEIRRVTVDEERLDV